MFTCVLCPIPMFIIGKQQKNRIRAPPKGIRRIKRTRLSFPIFIYFLSEIRFPYKTHKN